MCRIGNANEEEEDPSYPRYHRKVSDDEETESVDKSITKSEAKNKRLKEILKGKNELNSNLLIRRTILL